MPGESCLEKKVLSDTIVLKKQLYQKEPSLIGKSAWDFFSKTCNFICGNGSF